MEKVFKLVVSVINCLEKSELCLPEGVELTVRQPSDPSKEYFHQMLEKIECSFTAAITVKRPSKTDVVEKVVLGNKIRVLDAYLNLKKEEEVWECLWLSLSTFRTEFRRRFKLQVYIRCTAEDKENTMQSTSIPSALNIVRQSNKWNNTAETVQRYRDRSIKPENVRLHTTLCTDNLMLLNVEVARRSLLKWTEERKKVYLANGYITHGHAIPTRTRTI